MGSGRGKQRRAKAAGGSAFAPAAPEKEEKYVPVPGEHKLFESERGDGRVELHSKEIAGEHICYLAHTLTLPDSDDHFTDYRNFLCTIASEGNMAEPYMSTPKDRDGNINYLIMVKDLANAFKMVGENNTCVVFPGSGPHPEGTPSFIALTYVPPTRRKERPKVMMSKASSIDGVVSVNYRPREKGKSSAWRSDLGEFYLDDVRSAAKLLEEDLFALEQEFEDTQTQRREALYGARAKSVVLDLEPATF